MVSIVSFVRVIVAFEFIFMFPSSFTIEPDATKQTLKKTHAKKRSRIFFNEPVNHRNFLLNPKMQNIVCPQKAQNVPAHKSLPQARNPNMQTKNSFENHVTRNNISLNDLLLKKLTTKNLSKKY